MSRKNEVICGIAPSLINIVVPVIISILAIAVSLATILSRPYHPVRRERKVPTVENAVELPYRFELDGHIYVVDGEQGYIGVNEDGTVQVAANEHGVAAYCTIREVGAEEAEDERVR